MRIHQFRASLLNFGFPSFDLAAADEDYTAISSRVRTRFRLGQYGFRKHDLRVLARQIHHNLVPDQDSGSYRAILARAC